MALPRPLPAPKGITEMQWAGLSLDPGLAAARWLEAHAGVALEEEGPNEGKLLREWLYDARAVDGQPYCAALTTSVLWALGVDVPALEGEHWFWDGRSALALFEAFKDRGWGYDRLLGPPPEGGFLVFSERAGGGGHVDFLLDLQGPRMLVVGANVGNTIKVRSRPITDALGFGFVPRRAT